jgi:hypothetical protein
MEQAGWRRLSGAGIAATVLSALPAGGGLVCGLADGTSRSQALIRLGASLPVISILRGLALSAIGMRRVSTPAS